MSDVYFIRIDDADKDDVRRDKFSRLLDTAGSFDFIEEDDDVAIKMHFGEEGNTRYVEPAYVKLVAGKVVSRKANPVLTDSNALYRGKRTFSKDHLKLAQDHGFTKANTGASVSIAEGLGGADVTDVDVKGKFIKTAKVGSLFYKVDCIISVAHFKGHLATGIGGTIKNLGMGCASREGKLAQHSDISPHVVADKCVGCGACIDSCPVEAITLVNKKAEISGNKCIGCAECIAICEYGAIDIDWESGMSNIQEKMAEYAKAALVGKEDRSLFINFAVQVAAECDCWPKDYPLISPDAGILMSKDPVAIDKASYDLVVKKCGKDVFKEAHPTIDGMKQLRHASDIGLGSLEYRLIEVK